MAGARTIAAERVLILQQRKELDRVVDAVEPELQALHVVRPHADLRFISAAVRLVTAQRKGGLVILSPAGIGTRHNQQHSNHQPAFHLSVPRSMFQR